MSPPAPSASLALFTISLSRLPLAPSLVRVRPGEACAREGAREEEGGRREEGGVGSDAQVLTLLIVTPLQALTLRTHARACSEAITYEGREKAVGDSSKRSLKTGFRGFKQR